MRRQDIARFLAKHELFSALFPQTVAPWSAACSPVAVSLDGIIFRPSTSLTTTLDALSVFDTFDGFPYVDPKDLSEGGSKHRHYGTFRTSTSIQEELRNLAAIHDANRPLGHISKIELVPGDACETIPRYVAEHPSLLVSLLYIDLDLYAPTKVALSALPPRVPRGGVVAFDELNRPEFAGETSALLESLDIRQLDLRLLPIDPYISWFIRA